MSHTIMDIEFRKVVPAANIRRFYRITVTRDLFGKLIEVRRWGRIGTHGQRSETSHDKLCDAHPGVVAVMSQRVQRGYIPTRGSYAVENSLFAKHLETYRMSEEHQEVATAKKAVPRSPVRRRAGTPSGQMALWQEGQMPVRCANQAPEPSEECVYRQDNKGAVEDKTRKLMDPFDSPVAECLQVPLRQHAPGMLAKFPRRLSDAVLTRQEVERAENFRPPTLVGAAAFERERMIEELIGIPRAGWVVGGRTLGIAATIGPSQARLR